MGTGVGEAMLISAVTGAGTSAVMGGDPLKGAMLGAATGGIGHGIAGATTSAGANAATNVGAQTATDAATNIGTQAATDQALLAAQSNIDPALLESMSAQQVGQMGLTGGGADVMTQQGIQNLANYPVSNVGQTAGSSMFPRIAEMSKSGYFYPGLGVAASFIGDRPSSNMPENEEYSGPLSRFRYDPDRYRRAASGGLMDTMPARRMAGGGHLGSYSDGGQLLKGPGDGMSDDIPASIGEDQPALLADGEFVVPADVVSGLGNGSTDAGARQLYAMMDAVRKARTGREKQAPEIDADEYMPA